MSRILIMSDIHGNLSALNKIWKTEEIEEFEGIVLLGDLIDYGPHSNEVVEKLKCLPKHKILVNIWGNHEKAVVDGDDSRFSSERGKKCAAHTRKTLTKQTMQYLENEMDESGHMEFELAGKKCLAVMVRLMISSGRAFLMERIRTNIKNTIMSFLDILISLIILNIFIRQNVRNTGTGKKPCSLIRVLLDSHVIIMQMHSMPYWNRKR